MIRLLKVFGGIYMYEEKEPKKKEKKEKTKKVYTEKNIKSKVKQTTP